MPAGSSIRQKVRQLLRPRHPGRLAHAARNGGEGALQRLNHEGQIDEPACEQKAFEGEDEMQAEAAGEPCADGRGAAQARQQIEADDSRRKQAGISSSGRLDDGS